jgi:glycosyltransferase involved in cell wall biosynthesis
MKIHFLLTQDLESPSGLGRYWPIAQELVKLGYSVTISALHSNFNDLQDKHFVEKGVDIKYVSPMHVKKRGSRKYYYSNLKLLIITIRATIQLIQSALNTPTDIIYIGKPHPMNSIAGLIFKIIKRKRVFLDCDDYEIGINYLKGPWQKLIIRFFENLTPRFVDFVTTNTFFNRDRLINIGIPKEKITYLPNGIDPGRFNQIDPIKIHKIREKLNLRWKKVISYIGTLGIFSHPIPLLLDAFHIIKQTFPTSVLLLVGGGEDYRNLHDRIRNLDALQNIILTGKVSPNDVPLYYAVSNVSVDPVFDNPAALGRSPLKLFESWFCGVPFITGDVGDRKSLIGTPPAGLVVTPGSSKELADGIIKILSCNSLAETYIHQGFERVKGYYWNIQINDFCSRFLPSN